MPDEETDYDDLPAMPVTINQLVAYNVAYFRKERGLTQAALGDRLEAITHKPWSKATMSALERSWDGNRIRLFDADDIMALSRALEYPIGALFLPPTDDGTRCAYKFRFATSDDGFRIGQQVDEYGSAEDLMNAIYVSDPESSYAEDAAYVDRLQAAFGFYFGGEPDYAVWGLTDGEGAVDESEAQYFEYIRVKDQIATVRGLLTTLEKVAVHLKPDPDAIPEEEVLNAILEDESQSDLPLSPAAKKRLDTMIRGIIERENAEDTRSEAQKLEDRQVRDGLLHYYRMKTLRSRRGDK